MAVAVRMAALLAALALSADAATGANPIRKVVTLLQDMQKEIDIEGAKEKELFDKFMCFCQGNTAELEKGIADSKAKVEELNGKLKEDSAERSQLELQLVQHEKDLAAAMEDLSKAESIRAKEKTSYEAESAEAKKNIEALGGAVTMLGKGMGAELLVQVPGIGQRVKQLAESYSFQSEEQRREFVAFLENKGDYVPQSGQILGMLKSMKDEMEAGAKQSAADEASSEQGFQELKDTKDGEVSVATEAIKAKKARSGELAVTVAQTKDDIEDTGKELADGQKYLDSLLEACPAKEKEWAERTKTRSEEIASISQAIDILNSDDALETFKKAAPESLLQEQGVHRYGFLQQRQDSVASRVQRAQALLQGVAQNRVQSRRLQLALYVARSKLRQEVKLGLGADFGNITGMVDDMIVLEEHEQGDDDKQKPWCNGEFDKEAREETKEKSEVASLEAEQAEEQDLISAIDDEVAALKEEIEELDKSVAKATEQRKAEHAEYVETNQVMKSAVELIGKAKNKLLKFYNPALATKEEPEEDASFFAQVRRHRVAPPEMPETFGSYEKKDQKSGGVMALMDMIARELEASIRDSEHDESSSQKDYVKLMSDSQESRAQDVKSITTKETAKAELLSKKTVAKEKEVGDLKDLDIIAGYVRELHGSCDFILENYGIRKEARHAEIESLKNAKAMLGGAKFQ